MLWCDQLAQKIEGPQTINDSKTPSGRVHVGALRGVIIHDVMFRVLKERGVPVRYIYGVDDYDPVDEIPYGQREHFEKYLGAPLCNTPPPDGSNATDMAEHFIREFFQVFEELGVKVETYRMRDIYRSGKFNESIDTILRNADKVRRIYKEVSGAERADTWFPFQTVCEKCGRIGTTEVTTYDGKEVTYTCRPDLVKWARGCGYAGKVSPFDGRGKLPWKLEWPAKWTTFPVTIEGAGKDHSTKGGSRDVSEHCLREIFGTKPPMNIPYEFFLVGGAKMSSSRGVGASARDMANFLPPEVLRFLMTKPQPKHPVNFSPDEVYITKLFNEFDRYHWRTYHDAKAQDQDKRLYLLSEIAPEGDFHDANFQLVVTLVQMTHLNLVAEIEKRKGSKLTELELKHLNRRIQSAKYWLENYATEEEKTKLQETLPARAQQLTQTQRAFLNMLADALPGTAWEDEPLQHKIFEVERLVPIEYPVGFQAIYRVLLDRDSGPKAGNLLAFLDSGFVLKQLKELTFDKTAFWRETGLTEDAFEQWLLKEKVHVKAASARADFVAGVGVVEFTVTMDDEKTYAKRVITEPCESAACAIAYGNRLADQLAGLTGVAIQFNG
ncbi:MAG: lysine--tRNA ligase [Verrucomicrobia bacterium]|nr:lysine--tRNA ligase [Verrucomicrobiota bacterium]